MYAKLIKYAGIFLIIVGCLSCLNFTLVARNSTDNETYHKYGLIVTLENAFYDLRMNKVRDKSYIEKQISLVAIDDESIRAIGKWPFPRDVYIKLIKKLKGFGAKTVAFDVFFSEESLQCPGENVDKDFGKAIAEFQDIPGNSIILPYSLSPFPELAFEEFPEDLYMYALSSRVDEGMDLIENYVEKKVYPIPELTESFPTLSHIQTTADVDGIIRHYQLVGNVAKNYLPSFSLSAYLNHTSDQATVELLNADDMRLKVKTGNIPLNIRGETKVRWIGNEKNFESFSMIQVLNAPDYDPVLKEKFGGNMVFIGSTAYGAHDLRHTPVDPMMPGVLFHMNMAHMLLEGKFFRPFYETADYSFYIFIIATLLIVAIGLFGNAIFDLAGLVAIIGVLLYLDISIWTPQGYEIRLFYIILSVVGCYSWCTFLHFYLSNKDKQFLKSAFGNYISPELIDEMYQSGEPPKLGGDSGIRTAYFTDIQGFSTFSEKLSATQLVELLNEYLTAMTDILLFEKGTLDKYEGDAIIAFFGAPMPLEDHAARSCLVAHQMQEKLAELRLKWQSEGDKWPQIVHEMRMRIGINSGEIVTGNMGSNSRMNYTMMGDSVNLAARLEESAKQYGIFTQVSQESKNLAGEDFLFRELDTVKVVGKSVPVTSYDLLGLKNQAPEFLHQLSEKFSYGISLYKAQRFQEAIIIFQETLVFEHQRFPELNGVKTNPSEVYLERCDAYIKTPPPPQWDGVWTLTSK